MKHIFTIHSHITFLAALGVMATDKIDTNEVVLITGSNYKPKVSEKFQGEIINSLDVEILKKGKWERLKQINYTISCNNYIKRIIKENNFIAYIDLMSVFNRYLVMNPNCKGFHIIEEGIVNYADYDDFNLWTADLRQFTWQWNGFKNWRQMLNAIVRLLRGRSLRMLAMPIHPNLYTLHNGVNAYCFSEQAFTYTRPEKKQIISFELILPYIKHDNYLIPDHSCVWIGDTLSSSYNVSMEHFEQAIMQLMEEVNPSKEKHKIFLKFRGPESKKEKEITLNALRAYNFEIEFIDADVIMELEFLRAKNLYVLGIASSLLIYAHLMGHTTYSMFKFIPNIYGVSLMNGYQTISKKVGFLS